MKYNKNIQNQVIQKKIFKNLKKIELVGIFPPNSKKI